MPWILLPNQPFFWFFLVEETLQGSILPEGITELKAAINRAESRRNRKITIIAVGIVLAAIILLASLFLISLPLPPAPPCLNNAFDEGEEGIDCGGICAAECPVEQVILLSNFETKPASLFDVETGPDGKFYLVDKVRNKVLVYDSEMNFVANIGEEKRPTSEGGFLFVSGGPDDGKFDFPMSAAVDNENRLVVLDRYNKRLQLFSSDFKLLKVVPLSSGYVGEYYTGARFIKFDSFSNRFFVSDQHFHKIAVYNKDLVFQRSLGEGKGSGENQFNNPEGIAFDSEGNVFIADRGNNRIQVFDSNLKLKSSITSNLSRPKGLAIGSDDTLFVVDEASAAVLIFNKDLDFVGRIGAGEGFAEDELYRPRGIAVSSSGTIYVADTGNCRLKIFNQEKEFVTIVNCLESLLAVSFMPLYVAQSPEGKIVVSDWLNSKIFIFSEHYDLEKSLGSKTGPIDYRFNDPRGIAFDNEGRLFVADKGNKQIKIFDSKFVYLETVSEAGGQNFGSPRNFAFDKEGNVYISDVGRREIIVLTKDLEYLRSIGTIGEGKLSYPLDLVISNDEKIYTNDSQLNAVHVFDLEGNFLQKIPAPEESEKFSGNILIDSKGNILVPDHFIGRINVLNPKTLKWTSFGTFGEKNGQFNFIKGLDLASDGRLIVGNAGNHRIDFYSKDFEFLESISIN